jgi:hypothetical protein
MSKDIEEIKEDFNKWFNSEIKGSPNFTILERLCGFSAWMHQQQKIEQLEKEVESIRIITDNSKVNQNLIEEIETLNKIIKDAINLPKGIEPHSYSDYKINKQLN